MNRQCNLSLMRKEQLSCEGGQSSCQDQKTPLCPQKEADSRDCSPEQIAGRLRRMNPDDPSKQISHETIYAALYALPKGELRKELIESLRQGKQSRRPRSRGTDRRGQIPNMVSIHERPAEIEERQVPEHWEGDLIKGARNQSAIGTLVERQSRYLLMARMDGADAQSALHAFTQRLRHVPRYLRKTMTYDRGKEMSLHEELAKAVKIQVYFADPYSPWQRGCNENTNGLIRQYLPKGIDLSEFSHTPQSNCHVTEYTTKKMSRFPDTARGL